MDSRSLLELRENQKNDFSSFMHATLFILFLVFHILLSADKKKRCKIRWLFKHDKGRL